MRYVNILLATLIIYVATMNQIQPARAAAPLVVPAGAYAASFAYAAGAVAVGAIGTAVGFEYGDQIRQYGMDAWSKASNEVKNAWQSIVDTAVAANTLAYNAAQFIMDNLVDWYVGMYGNALSTSGAIEFEKNSGSGLSSTSDIIYADSSHRIYVNGYIGDTLRFLWYENIVKLENGSKIVATFPIPVKGNANVWGKYNALGARSIKKPSTFDITAPPIENALNNIKTSSNRITMPPITAYQPITKNGEELVYDYYTGTATYKATGMPFLGSLETDVDWQIPQIVSTVVAGQRDVGFILGEDYISTKTETDIKPYDLPPPITDFWLRYRPANDVINMSLENLLTYPLDIVINPADAMISDIDVVITPTGVAEFDIETGLITAVGAGTATLTIKHKYDAIAKQIDITINVADTAIPYEQIIADSISRVETNTATIADAITNPVGAGSSKVNWDKLKTTAGVFTTKFPFSLPWDVANAFTATFASITDDSPPEFVWEFRGETIRISIHPILVDMAAYLRAALLIMWDLGMIYAVRKLLGGAS